MNSPFTMPNFLKTYAIPLTLFLIWGVFTITFPGALLGLIGWQTLGLTTWNSLGIAIAIQIGFGLLQAVVEHIFYHPKLLTLASSEMQDDVLGEDKLTECTEAMAQAINQKFVEEHPGQEIPESWQEQLDQLSQQARENILRSANTQLQTHTVTRLQQESIRFRQLVDSARMINPDDVEATLQSPAMQAEILGAELWTMDSREMVEKIEAKCQEQTVRNYNELSEDNKQQLNTFLTDRNRERQEEIIDELKRSTGRLAELENNLLLKNQRIQQRNHVLAANSLLVSIMNIITAAMSSLVMFHFGKLARMFCWGLMFLTGMPWLASGLSLVFEFIVAPGLGVALWWGISSLFDPKSSNQKDGMATQRWGQGSKWIDAVYFAFTFWLGARLGIKSVPVSYIRLSALPSFFVRALDWLRPALGGLRIIDTQTLQAIGFSVMTAVYQLIRGFFPVRQEAVYVHRNVLQGNKNEIQTEVDECMLQRSTPVQLSRSNSEGLDQHRSVHHRAQRSPSNSTRSE